MKGYYKDCVQFHSDGFRPSRPAVKVKAYQFPDFWDLSRLLDMDPDTQAELIEQAGALAWESAAIRFWERAQEIAADVFWPKVRVYSEGSSGGWLVVDGIDADVSSWDAIDLHRWAIFEQQILSLLADVCDPAAVLEDIQLNRWAEPGAELFNFIERADGSTVCILDLGRDK